MLTRLICQDLLAAGAARIGTSGAAPTATGSSGWPSAPRCRASRLPT